MYTSRRSIIFAAGTLATSWTINPIASLAQNTSESYADPAAAEQWLSIWMDKAQAANTPLHLGRFADRMYFLLKKISWAPEPGQQGFSQVEVPVGFVTDFASIPRVFWSVLPPDGTYTYAAIIHDYLYWEQPVSKRDADMILNLVMEEFKVDAVSRSAIYRGVDAGGGFAWRKNAALKASGQKRVLHKFPEDPKITWTDWKERPGSL